MNGGRWETRIAVVDSDAFRRARLVRRVQSLGLEARAFEPGDELLRALHRLEIDGVVLGLRPPASEAALVARVAATGLAPIVTVVDPDSDELRRRALSAGAFACVAEPPDPHVFRRVVFAALTGEGAHGQGRAASEPEDLQTDRGFHVRA